MRALLALLITLFIVGLLVLSLAMPKVGAMLLILFLVWMMFYAIYSNLP